jgi:acyl-CoA thioesterase-1
MPSIIDRIAASRTSFDKARAPKQPDPVGYGGRRAFLQSSAAILLAATLLPAAAWATDSAPMIKLIAFGDSLSAGFQLPAAAAFPAVLEKELRREGYHVAVANAGVSGDTSSGGLARLDWSIAEGADGLILELGANDMLRGIDPEVTKAALGAMLQTLKSRNIKVLIAGMRASPSLGRDYKARFDAIFPDLSAKYGAPLYPFFLEGVAGERGLTLADGIHPNAAGVERIAQGILPSVRALISEIGDKAGAR